MTVEAPSPRRSRVVGTTNAEARTALQATLAQFGAWRLDLARFGAQAERRCSEQDRMSMLDRCTGIQREAVAARTMLLASLMDAPQRVAGHSRVIDAERALDNIEADVSHLRRKLSSLDWNAIVQAQR